MMLYVIKSAREIWQGGCIQTNLLSLDMVLKTLVFKLWGITKDLQERKRADHLHLFKSEPILAETQTPILSSQSTAALFMHRS